MKIMYIMGIDNTCPLNEVAKSVVFKEANMRKYIPPVTAAIENLKSPVMFINSSRLSHEGHAWRQESSEISKLFSCIHPGNYLCVG